MTTWWERYLEQLDLHLSPWWLTQVQFTARRCDNERVLVDLTEYEDERELSGVS
jgi:hypothetical protein